MIDNTSFEKALARFSEELARMRANRATPTVVESVRVEVYGTTMSLQELASITAPEPQLLLIQPWDKTVVKGIEAALRKGELGVQPVVDGDLIRLPFPPLTEDKRRELVKLMHTKAEEARIAVRKAREESLKECKQREKDGEISEDEYFRLEKEIQSTVNRFNDQIKVLSEKKEKELMTI